MSIKITSMDGTRIYAQQLRVKLIDEVGNKWHLYAPSDGTDGFIITMAESATGSYRKINISPESDTEIKVDTR